jgi:hypothetical protein
MTALSIQPPFPIITDTDGQPLEDGYIWIGVANLPPIGNPIAVYWDAALTQPATLPVRTRGGYPVNAGTPARLYVNSDYSIQVQNKNGSVVYSAPQATERYGALIISSADVSFLQAGSGAVVRTAQSKMRDVVSVKDFGAVGDGVADDTVAIQAAINAVGARTYGGGVYFPAGEYVVTDTITVPAKVSLYGESIGVRQGNNQQCGAVLYKKHANNCVVFNKTVSGWQEAVNIGIVGVDASNTGGSGFVINTSDVILNNCKVWGVYLHSFVVGDGTATSYANELIGCYSNNPQTGSNYIIDSTLFRGHNLLSDGGVRGMVIQPAATNWSIGECHFEGFKEIGISIGSSQGKTYGKNYCAGTHPTGLIGVQVYGSASGCALVGLQIAFNAVRAGSKGLEIKDTATTITLRDSTISSAENGVFDVTTGSPAATYLDGNTFVGCTVGIKAASQGSKYIGNTFIGTTSIDISHDAGSGGLWMGNRFSLSGNNAINPGVTGQAGNFGGNAVKNNYGYVSRNSGYVSSLADNGTIDHGLSAAPVTNGSVITMTPTNTGLTSPVCVYSPDATKFYATWTGTTPNSFTWEARLVCDF